MSNLTSFFAGQLLSSFAFDILSQSVSFHILNSTGNIAKFALPFIIENVVKSVVLLFSGYIVDRFRRKFLYIAVDFIQFIYLSTVFYLMKIGSFSTSHLLIIPFISAIFKAISYPSNKAVVQSLARIKKSSKARSFEISNDKVARTLAPVIAILFFAKFGIEISILVSALMFALSSIIKTRIILEEDISREKKLGQYLTVGFRELFKSKIIVLAWLNAVVSQIIFHPFIKLVIPKVIKLRTEVTTIPRWLSTLVYFLGNNSSDITLGLIAFVQFAGGMGAIISLFLFQFFDFENIEFKGMKYTTLFLIPLSALFFVTIYLSVFNGLDSVTIAYILFPMTLMFFLILNSYNVFFTLFYQKRVPKSNTGRFFGALLSIYMLTKAFGYWIYKVLLINGLFLPCFILFIAAVLKYFIFIFLEKEYNAKEV